MSNKISIIVPAYNIAEFLPRCLDSILSQTYRNLEVIVISDGSTDGTNEIINNYAKKDNRIIPVFKNNTGVSDTRNKGIDQATGDWIGFVDGDDYIEPEMYERLLNNALKFNADISHCGYQMVFPSRIDYYYNTRKIIIQDNEKGIIDLLSGDYIEPGLWNKLFRKSCIEEIRLSEDIKINEDLLFNFFAFVNSKQSIYEDISFYHYILRKGSAATSGINDNKLFDPMKVKEKILDYSKKNLSEQIQSVSYTQYLHACIGMYRQISKNKQMYVKKGVAKEYKDRLKKHSVGFSLSKKTQFERVLFLYFTPLHMFIYRLYDRFFSKNMNKYEVR